MEHINKLHTESLSQNEILWEVALEGYLVHSFELHVQVLLEYLAYFRIFDIKAVVLLNSVLDQRRLAYDLVFFQHRLCLKGNEILTLCL